MSWSTNTTFTEVIENQRLVGDASVTGLPDFEGAATLVSSLEFIDEDGGTRLELREGPYSTETEVIAREFWLQSFTNAPAPLVAGLSAGPRRDGLRQHLSRRSQLGLQVVRPQRWYVSVRARRPDR